MRQIPALYEYDAEGFFTRSFPAQPHPAIPGAFCTEVRNAVLTPLPGDPKKLERWKRYRITADGKAWGVATDNRGREGYDAQGGRMTVNTPELPGNWHGEEPPKPVLTLEEARAATIMKIDAETSASILAGFDYKIDGQTLHFSYDTTDQQNFADTANIFTLIHLGITGAPETVTWNGWAVTREENGGEVSRSPIRLTLTPESFLALYMEGALLHKAMQMELGGTRKVAAEHAKTREDLEAV